MRNNADNLEIKAYLCPARRQTRFIKNRSKVQYLFIVNPISGGRSKEAIVRMIGKYLDPSSYEVVRTEFAGHATQLAHQTKADVVVAVGGDGTVSEVAKGLISTGKALGIIPCGSGDGLALHLGISRHPRKALRELVEGAPAEMDYALLDTNPFFCTAGVGLDAEVAWAFASSGKRGLGTYISLAWKIWQGYRPSTYTIEVDGTSITFPAVMVIVGNVNQWGNQARITSKASACDGMLDVAVVAPFHTYEIPVLAAKLLDGRAHTSRRVRMLRGRRVVITRPNEGPAHFDGDPCREGRILHFEIVPKSLKVMVPKGHSL